MAFAPGRIVDLRPRCDGGGSMARRPFGSVEDSRVVTKVEEEEMKMGVVKFGFWKTYLRSSFYSDFEEFENQEDDNNDEEDEDEDDDDEEDDDEYSNLDEAAVANFRSQMGNLFDDSESSFSDEDDEDEEDEDEYSYEDSTAIPNELSSISSVDDLISFATAADKTSSTTNKDKTSTQNTEWAKPVDVDTTTAKALQPGVVLLANPAKFCTDFSSTSHSNNRPSAALLSKFGLTLPPPAELGPDRRADLLPVLVLLDRHPLRGCRALLMNRRTGYLLGDLEQPPPTPFGEDGTSSKSSSSSSSSSPPPPKLGVFMIQPLWFGGTSPGGGGNSNPTSSDSSSSSSSQSKSTPASGLDMIHLCPTVPGAKRLTEDGLFWGGDPEMAAEVMTDPQLERVYTGFDFKFFVQSTRWLPMQVCLFVDWLVIVRGCNCGHYMIV